MKTYFLVLLLIPYCFESFATQNYWIRIQSPTTKELKRCAFTDSLNGWIAGDSALILNTTDGGNNWITQNSSLTPNYTLNEIFFLNQRLGWAIGIDIRFGGSALIRTTNGGINWNSLNFPDTSLNTVYFIDSLIGFLGGWDGMIFKTTNAGVNWSNCSIDSNRYTYFPKIRFYFLSQQIGVACGGIMDLGGPIWKTTNSGLNWFIIDTVGEPVYDIKYLDPNKIAATGGDFELGVSFEFSSDGGNHWRNSFLQILGVGKSIANRTNAEVWIPTSFGGGWKVSFDSTRSWDTVFAGGNVSINDTKFIDPYHGWAIGSGGAIFKYNKDIIGINEIRSKIPVQFFLSQNYPNPFNPATIIHFELPSAGTVLLTVRLVIYDILGREVAILVNEQLKPGSYKVEWNASNYSSGLYLYKLSAGDFTETKKMVLIR